MQKSPNTKTVKEQLEKDPLEWAAGLCHICRRAPAVWSFMPGEEEACDDCVPRGCSCQENPETGKQWADARGRLLPCVEWMKLE